MGDVADKRAIIHHEDKENHAMRLWHENDVLWIKEWFNDKQSRIIR